MRSLYIVSLILGMWLVTGVNGESFGDFAWRDISREIMEVNVIWVDSQNPKRILAGTNLGVFKTEDGGNAWQAVLFGANKRVNFLYVDQVNKNLIYACCSSGLFFSRNQGKSWKRIYKSSSELEANCLSLIKLKDNEVYLGTEAGLFNSQNNGRIWHRFPGKLGNLTIRAIVADKINKFFYLITPEGAYRVKPQEEAKRIFVSHYANLENADIELEDDQFNEATDYQINHICLDPNNPQDIYLATAQGAFKSPDSGRTWRKFSDFGLLDKEVRFISISSNSIILTVTKSGVFAYNKDRWQELSSKFTMQDIRFLTIDHCGNIYIAGDRGLFRSSRLLKRAIYSSAGIVQEFTIQQVQQAAIKYAQVVDPEQISAHRRLSRLKAILPDFNLDYDKTISTYNNSKFTRFSVGPRDWGISLKWNLSDLIWSEQQRLIDSQVRLMVKLRQDILDEVTRLYFECRRLQLELISQQALKPEQRQEKELRLQELTALLDGLTGGYLSKFGLTE